jgi:Glutamyl-tRNAGlu reductase, dimerisation domain
MRPGQDSVERIRRHEVSRALKKVNLSPEGAEVIERLSRSLVGKLLSGPISEVMARAEAEISFAGRPGSEASCGLEGNGSGAESSGPKTHNNIRENGTRYIEFEIGSDRVSNKPAGSNGETGGTGARSISA